MITGYVNLGQGNDSVGTGSVTIGSSNQGSGAFINTLGANNKATMTNGSMVTVIGHNNTYTGSTVG